MTARPTTANLFRGRPEQLGHEIDLSTVDFDDVDQRDQGPGSGKLRRGCSTFWNPLRRARAGSPEEARRVHYASGISTIW